jgi:hypothetical protein
MLNEPPLRIIGMPDVVFVRNLRKEYVDKKHTRINEERAGVLPTLSRSIKDLNLGPPD